MIRRWNFLRNASLSSDNPLPYRLSLTFSKITGISKCLIVSLCLDALLSYQGGLTNPVLFHQSFTPWNPLVIPFAIRVKWQALLAWLQGSSWTGHNFKLWNMPVSPSSNLLFISQKGLFVYVIKFWTHQDTYHYLNILNLI